MSYRKKKRTPTGQKQMVLTGMNADVQGIKELLPTGELYSGQPYQRPVLDRVVDKLVREWDPRLLTPLVVSFRDGRYNLVDGQHRVCAMRKKNGGKDVTALCRVYHGLTYEQEAELYYKLDRAKGHLRLAHATKALVESGADAEIIEIKRLLEDAGFVWALDKPTGEAFEVEATRAVINAYRLLGGAAFSRMLVLTARTWCGAPSSVKASFLSGIRPDGVRRPLQQHEAQCQTSGETGIFTPSSMPYGYRLNGLEPEILPEEATVDSSGSPHRISPSSPRMAALFPFPAQYDILITIIF